MKTIHKILITLGLVLLCFAGCESDLTCPSDTLVYSLDSVSVYGIGQPMTHSLRDSIAQIVKNSQIRVTFSVSSNCDSTDIPSASIHLGSNLSEQAFNISFGQFNKSLTVTHLVSEDFDQINYSLYFYSATHKFIKLSNIKLYIQ